MKKYALTLALLLSCFVLPVSAQQLKMAVVDLQKVFADYYKTKEADGRLKEILGSFQKEYQEQLADYQKLVDEATKIRDDANNATLSKEMRDDKAKALQIKVQDVKNSERKLQEFDVTRRKQLDDQSTRMRKNIVDEINKVIADMGAKEKYNFIFDKSGVTMNGTASLVYSDGVKDLTEEVIATMNANKPASTSAIPSAPTGTVKPKP